MKKLILLLALLTGLPIANARPKAPLAPHFQTVRQQSIPDGWYKATVEYYNYKTHFRNTYILKVKVVYGTITVIDFGNGGSVHSGYN